ncbi:Small ribosomal subunit protein uS10 domain-containing protein [Caenorhabditis elegans]|uniref:Small ribosomal subunit protein uS10 domain-containing protein n=1 Tax=Caenorhabditis elegans TaxID=6239 RepID=O44159_CAEEL|nr:Small ribosomal subunit protein uS10 domain-containing protein [Caenorhabditis elegans]CCD65118.1 Small ribosomal subunit protein uS10 domain-containing protein [Caenorhabditis elegans]|eukprot:NP_504475.1 Mitochondrial Ribosomal Protein, Large [Caenorhabditis elegans]
MSSRAVSLLSRVISQNRGLASLRETVGERDASLLYEPKFQDSREFPEYNTINVRIQGHDFGSLEKYQAYIHKTAKRFGFTVVDSYAVAAQTQKAITYKPYSTVSESEIDMSTYDRVVRLSDVAAPRFSLFSQIIRAHIPIGVTMTVKEHEKVDEDSRYIPDLLLKQKQEELKALDDPNVRRNLGWE